MKRLLIFALLVTNPLHSADTTLAERLVSPEAEVRERALIEFRKLPLSVKERFAPSLMVAMSDENPYVRDQAAELLKEIGGHSRPASSAELSPSAALDASRQRDQERSKTLTDLQKTKNDRYQTMKSELHREKNTQPDWIAMKAESGSGLKSTLLAGLGDSDPLIRSRSARRLSALNPLPNEALPLLEAMLKDPNPDCRSSAAVALSVYGAKAQGFAIQLGTLTNDPDEKVRIAAREALRQIQESR